MDSASRRGFLKEAVLYIFSSLCFKPVAKGPVECTRLHSFRFQDAAKVYSYTVSSKEFLKLSQVACC